MASKTQDMRGYDHEFVEPPPDDLLCLICLCVARDPQQINCCGKLLCRACLKEHKKGSNNCPQCRVYIHNFPNKKSERHILSLIALCDNSSNGCEWVGELRLLYEHLASCDFTLLPCPNECSKGHKVAQLLRKDLEKHIDEECPRRQYKCPHCQEAGEYQERITKHLKECPMVEIPCPKRRCKTHLLRRDLSKHRKECQFEKVHCKFSTIGCTKEVERKDLAEHEGDTQQHLRLAVDTVQQQQIKIENMQAQSRKMPVSYKFTNFNQHKTSRDKVYSPPFYTSSKGYKMCISVDANGCERTHVSVFAYLIKGENDDHLQWPFTGKVTIELLNQLADGNHHSAVIKFTSDNDSSSRVVDEERSSHGCGWTKYISHSDLGLKTAKNCQYLKDVRLHFRISVNAKSTSTPWLM